MQHLFKNLNLRRKYRLILFIFLLLAVSINWIPVLAQDGGSSGEGESGAISFTLNAQASTGSPNRVASSPIDPAQDASDEYFIVDDAPGLDTECQFREDGNLVFQIEVTRYIGNVNRLIANDLISVYLEMAVFDVDFSGEQSPEDAPERDRVLFNNQEISPQTQYLYGENDTWVLNRFEIPASLVHFAEEGQPVVIPGSNEIVIEIDTNNPASERVWCTAIDWAALSIEAPRPNLLVHGINPFPGSDPTAGWSQIWGTDLSLLGIPYEDIDLSQFLGIVALDSIQNNAEKIEDRVNELRDQWGVDQINIVAHSKGGLDSRHYIESNDTIEVLAMMGTPNGGTPLADEIQIRALRFSLQTLIPVSALNFAVPAAYQLTTPYMGIYNRFHGHNSNTEYVAIAGDYKFDGFGSNVLNYLVSDFYGGDSDLVVPVWSVHALNYVENDIISTSGSDIEAIHTSQITSLQFFRRLEEELAPTITSLNLNQNPLFALASVSAGNAPVFAPTTMSPDSTGAIADTIAQGETNIHTLYMDGTNPIGFTLNHVEGILGYELVSPSGTRITMNDAITNPDIQFVELPSFEGLMTKIYMVDNAEMGLWTIEVTGTQVTNLSGEEPYFIVGQLSSTSIHLNAVTNQQAYTLGDSIIVYARAEDNGTPILDDIDMTAGIVLADESIINIVLEDNGLGDDITADDGIYSGNFGPINQSGLHRIVVRAEGQPPAPFSRETLLVAPMSASTTTFAGTFSDIGVDTDTNGLYNELVIDVALSVSDAGIYRVLGELFDSNGNFVDVATTSDELETGIQNVSLSFDGATIFQNGINGPYNLKVVRVAEETDFTVLPLDEISDAYLTSYYDYRQFEHDPIEFPGTGQDQGVDTNNNGQFDLLEITLDVDLDNAGIYEWSGALVDVDGNIIGFSSTSANLNVGRNALTFSFDAEEIIANGADGPYFLNDVLIFSSTTSAIEYHAYETQAYHLSQFERPSPIRDADGDGFGDDEDACPWQGDEGGLGTDETGCPYYDADWDGIYDRDDACPWQGAEGGGDLGIDETGCPYYDADGDGVIDREDACPWRADEYGLGIDETGCPVPENSTEEPEATENPEPYETEEWSDEYRDADWDGFPDEYDACPSQGNEGGLGVDETGCPYYDADWDGVYDRDDECPWRGNEYGLGIDDTGCPVEANWDDNGYATEEPGVTEEPAQ